MGQDNISQKFQVWTRGLDTKEARVSVFNHIRDIPYSLVPQIGDLNLWACSILDNNKGSCSPKHILLGEMFTRLGIPVKYGTYPFSWNDPDIKYPAHLRELTKKIPTGYHCAIRANINNKWVLVDATWDPITKKFGFPVNQNWDGEGDTLNAVKAQDEILFDKVLDRMEYVKNKKSLQSDEDKALYAQFVEQFNLWLEKQRKLESS